MSQREDNAEIWQRFKERDEKLAQHRKLVTKKHYEEVQQARERGIPIAYCTGASPTEILYTLGIQPCMPENYVTIACARQTAEKFLEAAEARGLSRDVCSYSRVGMGMAYLNDGPYGALPKPDFIMSYPLICDPHAKWWELEGKFWNAPVLKLDGPFSFSFEVEDYQLQWMVSEIKKHFASIEQITGHKFDYDKFKEVMGLSSQARELFIEIAQYRQAIPCPRSLREILGDLFYLVTQLGTRGAVEYFTMVRDHVKERVEHGVGILPRERFRLLWDNIPLWYRLQLIDYFAEKGAVFAIDTYPTLNWVGYHFEGRHLDPDKPFESLALIQLYQNPWFSLDIQMKRLEREVKEWRCDGAVFFSNRGCQILSRAIQEKERLFRERTGALSMSFEAEMADPRSLHEAEVKARIDSFLEMLEERQKAPLSAA